MRGIEVMAFSPSKAVDPAIAIAACRAGAVGTLNLESCSDATVAQRALAQLAKHSATPFAVKLGRNADLFIPYLPLS